LKSGSYVSPIFLIIFLIPIAIGISKFYRKPLPLSAFAYRSKSIKNAERTFAVGYFSLIFTDWKTDQAESVKNLCA
jgi:hypothetical protein